MKDTTVTTVQISFIVPVYMIREIYLRKCLSSLICLRGKDIEIIVIDDGSPDNTGLICDEYAARDKRVKVFHNKHKGVSQARNAGIDLAIGKYLTFIDGDDWIEPNKMETLCSYVRTSEDDLIIYGHYINEEKAIKEIRPFRGDRHFLQPKEIDCLRKMTLVRGYDTLRTDPNAGSVCNATDKFIKKTLLLKSGIRFNQEINLGEDSIFNFEFIPFCKQIKYIDVLAYHYRMRSGSSNHRPWESGYEPIRHFAVEITKIIEREKLDNSFREALAYRCYDLIFEDMQPAYILPRRPIIKKLIAFQREMNEEPFASAIKTVKYKNIPSPQGKNRSKLLLFKLKFGWGVLLFKIIKKRNFENQVYE